VCRNALFMREDRSDDIPKFLEFFQHSKSVNKYFLLGCSYRQESMCYKKYILESCKSAC
jgi:hypothetical protein